MRSRWLLYPFSWPCFCSLGSFHLRLKPWWSMAMTTTRDSAERSEVFDFSDPIYAGDIQVVVRRDRAFAFTRPKDLKGKVMGGVIRARFWHPPRPGEKWLCPAASRACARPGRYTACYRLVV